MAWQARSGWKLLKPVVCNEIDDRLNGLASPFGLETSITYTISRIQKGLIGLASPFGVETFKLLVLFFVHRWAKWPGKPVRVGNSG